MGTAQELQRWQRILLFIVVAALGGSAFVGYDLFREARETNQAVSYAHAERVIEADTLQLALYQRAANSRGYLLTGDRALLEARDAARVDIDRQLAKLREQRIEPQIIADIDALLSRLDDAASRATTMYETSPEHARGVWERESKPVHDRLAHLVGELANTERVAFATARERAAAAFERSSVLLAILLVLVATLVVVLFYGYARTMRALLERERAEAEQTTFRLLEQVPVGIFVLNAKGKP